jgi:ATP-dependent DNA helicase RecG
VYTRKRGLDRETNKALLLKHIEDNARTGATLEELRQVLPALSAASVQWLVRQLKSEGKIQVQGKTRSARWFPVGGQLAGDEGGRNG